MTREIKCEQKSPVPFEDFLIFLFESASSATSTTSSQLSTSSQKMTKNGSITKIENLEEEMTLNSLRMRRNRRYSCPDFGADSELYTSFSSSSSTRSRSSIHEDDNDSPLDDDDDNLIISHSNSDSHCGTPAEMLSGNHTDTSLMDLRSDPREAINTNHNEFHLPPHSQSNSSERKRPSELSPENNLSFYKNFSASSRSFRIRTSLSQRESQSQSQSQSQIQSQSEREGEEHDFHEQQHPHLHRNEEENENQVQHLGNDSSHGRNGIGASKRFTRSVPTKLNKMSRLKSLRLYVEQLSKECPVSFDNVEREKTKSQSIDPTLNVGNVDGDGESATMSLFLDAVHLDLDSTTTTSPSFEIFYHY